MTSTLNTLFTFLVNAGTVEKVLWKIPSINIAQPVNYQFDLNDSVLNYDSLKFYMCHHYSNPIITHNTEIYEYNVHATIKNIIGQSSTATGALYLFQYTSYYTAICFPNTTTVKVCETSNSGYSNIRQITGVKYSNYKYIDIQS